MAIKAEEHPCWVPTCDGCGEGDNGEYGTSFHYASEPEAVEALRALEWTEHDGMWLCASCSQDRPTDEVDCPYCGVVAPHPCVGVAIVHQERLDAYVATLKARSAPSVSTDRTTLGLEGEA